MVVKKSTEIILIDGGVKVFSEPPLFIFSSPLQTTTPCSKGKLPELKYFKYFNLLEEINQVCDQREAEFLIFSMPGNVMCKRNILDFLQ
jgi:hypothetical protein